MWEVGGEVEDGGGGGGVWVISWETGRGRERGGVSFWLVGCTIALWEGYGRWAWDRA